jgi:hypothetical protein
MSIFKTYLMIAAIVISALAGSMILMTLSLIR